MKILIIEDDLAAREAMCQLIADIGHEVIGIPSLELPAEVKQFKAQIVFCDLRLGSIDLSVESYITLILALPTIKRTVLVSGFAKDLIEENLKACFSDLLEKPIKFSHMEDLLARYENECKLLAPEESNFNDSCIMPIF